MNGMIFICLLYGWKKFCIRVELKIGIVSIQLLSTIYLLNNIAMPTFFHERILDVLSGHDWFVWCDFVCANGNMIVYVCFTNSDNLLTISTIIFSFSKIQLFISFCQFKMIGPVYFSHRGSEIWLALVNMWFNSLWTTNMHRGDRTLIHLYQKHVRFWIALLEDSITNISVLSKLVSLALIAPKILFTYEWWYFYGGTQSLAQFTY